MSGLSARLSIGKHTAATRRSSQTPPLNAAPRLPPAPSFATVGRMRVWRRYQIVEIGSRIYECMSSFFF